MNVLEINTVNFGSTGNIMLEIAETAKGRGHTVWVAYPKYKANLERKIEDSVLIGGKISFWIHSRVFRFLGLNGCGSIFATLRFLRKIRKLSIDLVHIHNLHDCYINFPLLFFFLKNRDIPVIWTLHDCWPFTGKCPHYEMIGCFKWEKGCEHCQQIHLYPASGTDRTRLMWKIKKKVFGNIKRMLLVAPSQWMASQAQRSFLGKYPIKVIRNGIDLSVFHENPTNSIKSIDMQGNKYIVLGVSFAWGEKKGLDVFIELAKRLDTEKYQIVMVGTNDEIDKQLPESIISIHKTLNRSELADIYSAANVFVNPTREEVLGLVNLEALACGTPVVTFDSGGSPECIDETCGSVIHRNDIDAMEKEIIRICEKGVFSKEACRNRAQCFDKHLMLEEYIRTYEGMAEKH